jgi:DNA-binding MarR family transcriptional regulator
MNPADREPRAPSDAPQAAPDARLGFLLYRVGHEVGRAFERVLRAYQITPAHFGVLNAVHAYGAMHQQQVARLLGINRQTIANVVTDLAQRQLLERHTPPHDKRAYVLQLTPDGHQFLTAVDQAAVGIEQTLFALYSGEERVQLYALLARLARSEPFGPLFERPPEKG